MCLSPSFEIAGETGGKDVVERMSARVVDAVESPLRALVSEGVEEEEGLATEGASEVVVGEELAALLKGDGRCGCGAMDVLGLVPAEFSEHVGARDADVVSGRCVGKRGRERVEERALGDGEIVRP